MKTFGVRVTLTAAALLSTVAAMATPLFAPSGNMAILLVVRFIQGVSLGCSIPAVVYIGHNWSSLKRNGFYLTALTAFVELAPAFTYPVIIAVGYSSKFAHFTLAAFCALLTLVWISIMRDNPKQHPWKDGQELNKIIAGANALF